MYSISQSLRLKFGGLLRHLFQKPERVPPTLPLPLPEVELPSEVTTDPAPNQSLEYPSEATDASGVNLPLPAILADFPPELRSRILPAGVRELSLFVPVERIRDQLATGRVTMTFGELRLAAPDAFAAGMESDGTQVTLPLKEILPRLDPALLARRPSQATVQMLPEDILGPFDGHGKGLAIGDVNAQPNTPTPGSVKLAPVSREPALATTPATPVAPPPARSIAFALPTNGEQSFSDRRPMTSVPISAPGLPIKLGTSAANCGDASNSRRGGAHSITQSKALVQPLTLSSAPVEPAVLLAPLTELSSAWPEALRQEITGLERMEARVALPMNLIATSLKQGRVMFPWKTLRSWLRPPPPPRDSDHDATELTLPLNVIAPLFLAHRASPEKGRSVKVDEAIPDLFFRGPQPASALKLADDNRNAPRAESEALGKEALDLENFRLGGTDREAPATLPEDVVARAAELEGVAAAWVALPDGLLVTGRIPPEFNGDTLAAFLPQVFAKVSQAAKELRLVEVSELSFTAGDVPWRIFRLNALFFAAFGCPGGSLPNGELTRLAAELDRHH